MAKYIFMVHVACWHRFLKAKCSISDRVDHIISFRNEKRNMKIHLWKGWPHTLIIFVPYDKKDNQFYSLT